MCIYNNDTYYITGKANFGTFPASTTAISKTLTFYLCPCNIQHFGRIPTVGEQKGCPIVEVNRSKIHY